MPPLNVVALISGGKDSFFSILHCIRHGHKIVALANLHPPPIEGLKVEDLESFMYQTIGHEIIPLYEEALDIPLYQQAIHGTAIKQGKTYDPPQHNDKHDETEDLMTLLQTVKLAHPEVNAVSTGAILSDYQRTRVESVALRLGLTPISYLWQYPRIAPKSPVSLLEAMSDAGMDARIIKVSSGGLDDRFLWQNVATSDTMDKLSAASAKFGAVDDGAALGEGGEYETLVIDGPSPLWKKKIVVDDADCSVMTGDGGTASMRLRNTRLEDKHETHDGITVEAPALLDDHFSVLFNQLKHVLTDDESLGRPTSKLPSELDDLPAIQHGSHIFLPAIFGEGMTALDQTASIMQIIKQQLSTHGSQMSDIAYVSITLRSMSDFAAINKIYSASFSRPNPPARMTLACADMLPEGKDISISVTSVNQSSPEARTALHVQSISYWAPANVGPYSQAVTVPTHDPDSSKKVVFMAGQIPLEPATMQILDLPNASHDERFLHQAVLGLQHLHRVAMAMSVRQWSHCMAFVVDSKDETMQRRADIARQVWCKTYGRPAEDNEVNEDDDSDAFDVWHLKHGLSRSMSSLTSQPYTTLEAELFAADAPSLTVYRVDALPRGVQIEWVGFGSSEADGERMSVPHIEFLAKSFEKQMI